MEGNGGWWSAAYKVNSWLAGTLLIVGFLAGVGAFVGGMKYFRQEMVTADTYILKSNQDYISPEVQVQIVRERDAALQQRDDAVRRGAELADQVKQRDAIIAGFSDRKQAIADLENMRAEEGNKLERARIKLAMASPMRALDAQSSGRQVSGNDDLYQEYKEEVTSIEQNIKEINQKLLEITSAIPR